MTVNSSLNKIQYVGAGGVTLFPFPYPFELTTDIVTTIINSATGVDITSSFAAVVAGGAGDVGTVTITPAPDTITATNRITIKRVVAATQLTSYPESGPFPAKSHEKALDKLTELCQQIVETQGRAIALSANTAVATTPTLSDPVAGALLGWDVAGLNIVNYLAASTSLTPVSAFMATVLIQTTAALARATLGAAASGANGDITSLTALTTINGGPIDTDKNMLINGGQEVWQRGTSFAGTSGIVRCADRWNWNRQGGITGCTLSQQAGVSPTALFGARMQRDSGNTSVQPILYTQSLESRDCYKARGKTVTLSLKAIAGANFSGASGNFFAQIWYGTGTDENVAIGYTGGAIGGTVTGVATGALGNYSVSAAIPLTATEIGVVIQYTPVGTAGANDWLQVEELQLEIGSVATPFAHRIYANELMMCQRYFQKSFGQTVPPAQNAGTTNLPIFTQVVGASTGQYFNSYPLKVTMRASPTVIFYNAAAANAQARNFITNTDCAGTSNANSNQDQIQFTATTPAGTVAGQQIGVHFSADAEF